MKKPGNRQYDHSKLTELAEQRLEMKQAAATDGPLDAEKLLHELQVTQIELEMQYQQLQVHHYELENQNEELRKTRAELESALESYTNLYDFAPIAYFKLDAESQVIQCNHAAAHLLDIPRSILYQRRFMKLVCEKSRPDFMAFLKKTLASNDLQKDEFTLHLEDKSIIIAIEASAESSRQYCQAVVSDITDHKKDEEVIWTQANFDPLTGLPNRSMFYERLQLAIKQAHRDGLPMALLFIDLDQFKDVNDTLGHEKGDFLLKEVAQRLKQCVREVDTVARLGGDEFMIILGELDKFANIDRVAQSILLSLKEPFVLDGETAYVSASVGITLYPEDAGDCGTLIKNADQAMYAAKDAGRNRFCYFKPAMQVSAENRIHLVNDLRRALANQQLLLNYQPIIELASGAIHKAEALLRWQHPQRGLVKPADFIPIAEETGLIVDIGDWVFREAAQQAKHWHTTFDQQFQISVNKSPVQFRQNRPQQEVSEYLLEIGLPGGNMVVEITEGLLMDVSSDVSNRLLSFRDAGIEVSLDDFGTGYSSLSYLDKYDIDYLKIDRSFVHNLSPGSRDLALCEAIIVMAHKLGIKVIAEGIETAEQRDLLLAAGSDFGQGFFFSRPVTAKEFEQFVWP